MVFPGQRQYITRFIKYVWPQAQPYDDGPDNNDQIKKINNKDRAQHLENVSLTH